MEIIFYEVFISTLLRGGIQNMANVKVQTQEFLVVMLYVNKKVYSNKKSVLS